MTATIYARKIIVAVLDALARCVGFMFEVGLIVPRFVLGSIREQRKSRLTDPRGPKGGGR